MMDILHKNQDSIVQAAALLIRTARVVLKYADRHFYLTLHISLAKHMVLQSLFLNKGTMTLSDLATFTSTERHNITTLVNRLKKDGLVTARRDRQDRRFVNITITDEGSSVLTKAWPVARQISETLMLSMTEDDLNKSLKSLTTIYQNALQALGEAITSTESSG